MGANFKGPRRLNLTVEQVYRVIAGLAEKLTAGVAKTPLRKVMMMALVNFMVGVVCRWWWWVMMMVCLSIAVNAELAADVLGSWDTCIKAAENTWPRYTW